MYRILLVEDDDSLAALVKGHLESYDYAVSRCTQYERIPAAIGETQSQLVILDVNLPRYDGFYICREIRRVSQIPVLFISARSSSMDSIMGLSVGGDDYISKPFSFELLTAKIEAMLRRAYTFADTPGEVMEYRGLLLHVASATVEYQGETLQLTRNEFRIFYTLLSRRGSIVSREELMQALWQQDTFVDDNTLSVNVNRLRKKMADFGFEEVILTRKQQGYIIQ